MGAYTQCPAATTLSKRRRVVAPMAVKSTSAGEMSTTFPPTIEITGEAGDFIMLHYLMPHAASNNRNPQPHVAQFTRFNREDHRHYPLGLAEPSRYNDLQLQVMTSLGRRLLGVDPW